MNKIQNTNANPELANPQAHIQRCRLGLRVNLGKIMSVSIKYSVSDPLAHPRSSARVATNLQPATCSMNIINNKHNHVRFMTPEPCFLCLNMFLEHIRVFQCSGTIHQTLFTRHYSSALFIGAWRVECGVWLFGTKFGSMVCLIALCACMSACECVFAKIWLRLLGLSLWNSASPFVT